MSIQKKYCLITLLSVSSISYSMNCNSLELFTDVITRDPLDLLAARRAAKTQRTTQKINSELRAASKVALGSNGNYELVENRGPIRVVAPTEKQAELPKPKL